MRGKVFLIESVRLSKEAKRIDYIVVKENLPSYGERSEAFLRKVRRPKASKGSKRSIC